MTNAAFFAPIIRGAIINLVQKPWIVQSVGSAQSAQKERKASLRIAFEGAPNDEKEAAAAVKKAFASVHNGTVPSCIELSVEGKTERFLTAPDTLSLAQAESGAVNEWNCACASCASRADVVKNKTALVTGGAQGFGEELVRGLVKQGAVVFIADLNLEGAEKLAAALNAEEKKQTAFAVKVNVADEESVENMFETAALTCGGLDLCISNAGVLRASSILEQDMASFRFVTDINYTAFAVVTKHCARLMKRQYAAALSWPTDIIQINSKSGLEGSNKNGSYAGGKFGGIGLVESFALELVAYGIKVNAICPGNFFDGPLWSDPEKGLFVQYLKAGKVPGAQTVADVKAFYEAKVPMNRGCSGPDVLKAVLYLVEQTYETGQALPVTGGQVMLH
ncbi:MAG: SDR family NAD(P)-dependent oxidoreductase [Treponema maltophilum]